MDIIVFTAIGILGLVLLWLSRRPSHWGRLYIVSVILLCGMVYQQISFIDEYLVACVIIGGFLCLALRSVDTTSLSEDGLGKIHRILFYVLCFYFAAESLRGMLLTDALKIRWVVYFLMIALSALMLSRRSFALPEGRQLLKIIVKASLAYFIIYLAVGFLAEPIFGMLWHEGQNIIWGGSSYAMFPAILAAPSCFMLSQNGSRKELYLARITIFAVILAAFYFDSRSGYFLLLACMMIMAVKIKVKDLILVVVAFFAVLIFFTQFVWPEYQNFDSFWETSILSSSKLLWNQDVGEIRAGDIGRFGHIHLAPLIFAEYPSVLFIGTGYRASAWLIGPGLEEIFMTLGQTSLAEGNANYGSTVGLTSILLETGIIGMGLLLASMLCTWVRVKRRCKGQERMFLGLILLASFLWLFVTNPTDMPLYFLLIMPHGFLCRMVEGNALALCPLSSARYGSVLSMQAITPPYCSSHRG